MTLPNSSSINAYGSGVLVDAVPLVDPTSEMGAAALNPLRNDVAAMTTTSPRLIFQFRGTAGVPAIASTATWTAGNDSHWGNSFAVQPVFGRVSTGIYTVQLPSTVSDQIGNNNLLVNVRFGFCSMVDNPSGTPGIGMVEVTSSSTFNLRLFKLDGTSFDFAGPLFAVTVY